MKFSPALTQILDAELASGNEVAEVRVHYPDKHSIFVALKRPFSRAYPISHPVKFRDVSDPNYWKSEYEDIDLKHLLVCRF